MIFVEIDSMPGSSLNEGQSSGSVTIGVTPSSLVKSNINCKEVCVI